MPQKQEDPLLRKYPKLKIFVNHGVDLSGQTGDQAYGSCPFTGKENKFYVNVKTLLWDSKSGGQSGNVNDFLKKMSSLYVLRLDDAQKQKLADDRGLPVEAFKGIYLGWTGRRYTLPITDINGRVVDIRLYAPGQRMISTAGAETGMWNSDALKEDRTHEVYVCEGEWDAIALRWLLKKVNAPGIVVAVPGAGVLKPDWQMWLSGRRVHTLFDHDEAGQAGADNAYKKLQSRVQQLTFVHWPSGTPDGFDTRDFIKREAVEEDKPTACWIRLQAMFRGTPTGAAVEGAPVPASASDAVKEASPSGVATRPTASKWTTPPTLDQVHEEFRKWLFLDSTDAIDIMLATAISQQIDGEPIWMFLVGPPGSAKTETLSSLSFMPNAYMTSSVTPHSLISGANWSKGDDPSLIPRLDGKVMVIKDFTSILSMRDTDKDEIFGILRDAYDGKCGKEFGNGVVRNYKSRFTILAAVTPSIYALSSSHTALGERFLKFGVGDNLVHHSEDEIIKRAIGNINRETTMRTDLADVVDAFLGRRIKVERIIGGHLPTLTPVIEERIIALARFGARMRGSVTRDTYRNDIVTSRPSAEVGSRLGKQLAKLCQSLAVIYGRRVVTLAEYRFVKKVMLDTIPQRIEDMLRFILLTCPTETDKMTAGDLAAMSRYPAATVARLLQDLNVLDIVRRSSLKQGRSEWTLSPYIREAINKAGLYKTEEEVQRPSRLFIRVVKRRKKKSTGVTQ